MEEDTCSTEIRFQLSIEQSDGNDGLEDREHEVEATFITTNGDAAADADANKREHDGIEKNRLHKNHFLS